MWSTYPSSSRWRSTHRSASSLRPRSGAKRSNSRPRLIPQNAQRVISPPQVSSIGTDPEDPIVERIESVRRTCSRDTGAASRRFRRRAANPLLEPKPRFLRYLRVIPPPWRRIPPQIRRPRRCHDRLEGLGRPREGLSGAAKRASARPDRVAAVSRSPSVYCYDGAETDERLRSEQTIIQRYPTTTPRTRKCEHNDKSFAISLERV